MHPILDSTRERRFFAFLPVTVLQGREPCYGVRPWRETRWLERVTVREKYDGQRWNVEGFVERAPD